MRLPNQKKRLRMNWLTMMTLAIIGMTFGESSTGIWFGVFITCIAFVGILFPVGWDS